MLKKILALSLKNKIIASVAGFVFVIIALLYFIVIPTITDIKTMGADIESQRTDLENKYIKGQSLRKLSENLKNVEPKLELLNRIFINKNRELEFITTLENEANNNRIGQKINLSSPETTENKDFKKAGLQLFTVGNFIKQLKYLAALESLNYYINIKILEISPTAAKQNQTNKEQPAEQADMDINMFIDADTYWN